jgi:hypothetical protein
LNNNNNLDIMKSIVVYLFLVVCQSISKSRFRKSSGHMKLRKEDAAAEGAKAEEPKVIAGFLAKTI